jgi:ABC transporter substrate binding protein
VAAGGTGAARRARAAHRRAHVSRRERCRGTSPARRVHTGALGQLGWGEGRNLRIDARWANAGDVQRHAAELVAVAPDVLVAATGTAIVAPLLQATRTIPIVFAIVIDPVGAGFVASMAQPGGNATGLTVYEYSISGKWLELLKEIAPGVTRAAVLRDPAVASGIGQFGAVQIVAPALGVQLTPVDVRDAGVGDQPAAADVGTAGEDRGQLVPGRHCGDQLAMSRPNALAVTIKPPFDPLRTPLRRVGSCHVAELAGRSAGVRAWIDDGERRLDPGFRHGILLHRPRSCTEIITTTNSRVRARREPWRRSRDFWSPRPLPTANAGGEEPDGTAPIWLRRRARPPG